MNWADYLILSLIGLSMLISLFRGFLREVMALVVWVAAFWVAVTFSDEARTLLSGHIELPSAQVAVAWGGLFIATLIVGGMVNYLLGKLIEKTGLSGTDRFVGIFFGAGRGLILITAAVLFAGLTPLPQDGWWQESRLLPYFERLSQWAVTRLPENLRDYFDYAPTASPAAEPDAGPGGADDPAESPDAPVPDPQTAVASPGPGR